MALMGRSDWLYEYSWRAIPGDDPRITGKPDSTMFNRHEGYEVLALINRVAAKHNLQQKESGQKIERMIRKHLPDDVRSQHHVLTWIETNWKGF